MYVDVRFYYYGCYYCFYYYAASIGILGFTFPPGGTSGKVHYFQNGQGKALLTTLEKYVLI
jgi:hypothetical protein